MDLDPQLTEKLERLADLTDQEVTALDKALVAEFNRLDKAGHTPENVDLMEAIHDATLRVREESGTRASAAAEAEERAGRLREGIHPVKDAKDKGDKEGEDGGQQAEPDPGSPPSGQPGVDPKPSDDPDPLSPDKTTQIPTAVAADGSPAKPGLSEVEPPDSGGKTKQKSPALIASAKWKSVGQVRGPNAPDRGAIFDSEEQIAMATVEAIDSLGRGSGDPILVASLVTQFPAERTLGRDPEENAAKLDAVTSRQALVATGGICAPVAVDYNVTVGASDAEPIAAGLPDYNANRGGLRFIATPTFAAVGASGTGIWTAATDATPGGNTKPIQVITCGSEQVVYVDAIPTRLRFGNMMTRFSPEIVAANTSLAMANASRVREINRLNKIAAASTAVSTGQLLGAARDFLATLDQACAAVRYRHRLDDNAPLQAILPRWVKDMLRADFVREIGHDGNMFAITDAQIEAMLAARNVRAIWTLDGQAGGTAAGVAYVQQGFGAQTTNTGLLDWPHQLVWYLYPVGAFQRLDGGRLDVGVVRDSVLDSTNDYETFVETFEGIAFRGFESLELISVLRPNGASAGTVNTTTY